MQKTFFLPSLNNLDVLAFQLDKYIRITEKICEKMEKKYVSDFLAMLILKVIWLNKNLNTHR